MSELSTLEVLVKARAWLAEDPSRWKKRGYGMGLESSCAIGACARQLDDRSVLTIEEGPVGAALAEALDARAVIAIPRFNDDPNTTHADVLALFDRAIAAEEAKLNEAEKKKEEIPQAVPRRREDVGCRVSSPSSSPGVAER